MTDTGLMRIIDSISSQFDSQKLNVFKRDMSIYDKLFSINLFNSSKQEFQMCLV